MKRLIVIVLGVLILVCIGISLSLSKPDKKAVLSSATPIQTPTITPAPHLNPDKLLTLVNEYRTNHGLNKLASNSAICPFTYTRLQQTHTDWTHAQFRSTLGKYPIYGYFGENLARKYRTDEQTFTGWINSPTHLKNIVDPKYKSTCIETDDYNSETYVVQEFASY